MYRILCDIYYVYFMYMYTLCISIELQVSYSLVYMYLLQFRLREKCSTLAGDVGEDEIYKEYRKKGDLSSFLCKEFTVDCIRNSHEDL